MKKRHPLQKTAILLSLFACLLIHSPLSAQKIKHYISFEENGTLKSSKPNDNVKAKIVHAISNHNEITVEIPGALLYSIPFQSDTLHRFYLEGLTPFGENGQPELPAKNMIVKIDSKQAPEFNITSLDTITINHINVIPNTNPEGILLDELQDLYPNPNYTKNVFYPEKWIEVIDVQTVKNQSIAILQIHPIRFNPVTKQIKVARHLSFKMNPSGLKNTKTGVHPSPSYLILAPESFREQALQFSNWKKKIGYQTTVKLNKQWTPSLIKEAVQATYTENDNSLDYLLFIGDHEIIPAEEHYREDDDELKLFVTDLYYTCMDGKDDYLPDMAYGRLPASTPQEAQQLVDKIIHFEQSPPTNAAYYNTILGCAQFQDEDGDGYADRRFVKTSEDVGDYLKTKNYTYKRIYFAEEGVTPQYYNDGKYASGDKLPDDLLKTNGFKWDGNAQQIVESINEGTFFTFHRDHGLTSGLGWSNPEFTTEDVAKLDNPHAPTILYSINCHSGKFNIPQSFAEAMILHPNGGAIAAFCATNTSFSGYNDAMFVAMVDAIWNNPGIVPNLGPNNNTQLENHTSITTLGDILNYGKLKMLEQWSGSMSTHQHIFELFHLFGDPSMRMPIQKPEALNVTAPTWFSDTDEPITIRAANCPEGHVTASDHDQQLFFSGIMSGGELSIPSQDITTDSIQIVISQEGFLPYLTTIRKSKPLLKNPQTIDLSIIDQQAFPFSYTLELANVGIGDLIVDSICCTNTSITISENKNILINEKSAVGPLLKIMSAPAGKHCDTLNIYTNNTERQIPISYQSAHLISDTDAKGIWTKSNSPYWIAADITIKPQDELYIEAGVEIIVNQNVTFSIKGAIEANGTQQAPIRFNGLNDDTWNGLAISDGGSQTSSFKHCKFLNSRSTENGGAITIDNYNNVSFENCEFANNTSKNGGAAYINQSTACFTNCIFNNNSASFGGAMYLVDADITLTNSKFEYNNSTLYGGSAGAIHCKSSNPLIEGCVFHHNYAPFAGAVYLRDNSKGMLVNNTFTANLSNYGAGIRFKTESSTKIYNCIFWDNEAFSSGKEIYAYEDCEPSFVNCLIKGGKGDIKVYQDKPFNGNLTDCILQDPSFENATNSDFRIKPDSPAKDSGKDHITNYTFNTVDIQNGERFRYGAVDIGAYEFQNYAPIQVNISCDSILRNIDKNRFIGLLTTNDPDLADEHQYTLIGEEAQKYLFISTDSVYSRIALESLTTDSISFTLKTTDNGFGNRSFEKSVALKLSNQKLALTKTLSPIRTTQFPKDTLLHLPEYFMAEDAQAALHFQIGDSSNELVAKATLNNDQLNLSYKDIGRAKLPLTVTFNNETHHMQLVIEVWGPNAVQDASHAPITVFPNPCQDILFLKSDAQYTQNPVQIEIYDIHGARVIYQAQFQIKSNQTPINVSQLSKGAYCLKITTTSNKVVRQLFIKD